jgi:hypothetical protein
MWAPTFNAVQNLNVSLLLTFGLALVWRWRESARRLPVVLGLLVSLKLFLAPLLIWPLSQGRLRVSAAASALAVAFVLLPWAIIGFAGLVEYPELLNRVTDRWQADSYSSAAVLETLGLDGFGVTALVAVLTVTLVLAGTRLARQGDDLRALALLIAASLVASPIVWQHYLLLLVVPLAVARPLLSGAWLLPLLLWAAPMTDENGMWFQTLLVPFIASCLIWTVVRRPKPDTSLVAHPALSRGLSAARSA